MKNSEIVSVVEQLVEAENAMDRDAAGRLLAPDFNGITRGRGVEQDRAALLDELAHPKNPVLRQLEANPSVLQSGDLAVVRSVVAILDGSPPVSNRFRNTHVLTRQAGGWKCAAWQVTKLS